MRPTMLMPAWPPGRPPDDFEDHMVSPAGEEEMAAAEQVGDAPRGPQGRLADRRARLGAPRVPLLLFVPDV